MKSWVWDLLQELGMECWLRHPTTIRAPRPRNRTMIAGSRADSGPADEGRFSEIWVPLSEHRHHWVKMRTRLQHTLQQITLNHAMRQGHAVWSAAGQSALPFFPLPPYTPQRRNELLRLYAQLQTRIYELDKEAKAQAQQRPQARRLRTHLGMAAVTASRRPEPLCRSRP